MRSLTSIFLVLLAFAACDDGADGTTDAGAADAVIMEDGAVDPADMGAEPDVEVDAGAAESGIEGTWVDTFGTEHIITLSEWTQTFEGDASLFLISTFDADAQVIIAENDAGNMFSPGKFSRFDWTWVDDRLFFCQSAFDKDTAEDAANAEAADPSDPTTGGCGGMFPWSELLMP